MKNLIIFVFILFVVLFSCGRPTVVVEEEPENEQAIRASMLLDSLLKYYDSGRLGLFYEHYPHVSASATYLLSNDTVQNGRLAYLWPSSGVWSAANALWKATGDTSVQQLVEYVLLPGLSSYLDTTRHPVAYQSYLSEYGHSDRFYDDNIWLGIDFLETYRLTNNPCYLGWARTIWTFLMSGRDKIKSEGLYWCEQQKNTKNCCSNAPAVVFALRLFEFTGDSSFLRTGCRLYHFTQGTLQDSDGLYFDKVTLDGVIDRSKFAYNSGQMLQASVLLYRATGDMFYRREADRIASAALPFFAESVQREKDTVRLFRSRDVWFTALLLRGYAELYRLDNNPKYLQIFERYLNCAWEHGRYASGLLNSDPLGLRREDSQWLLSQAAYAEMFALLAQFDIETKQQIDTICKEGNS